jgi:hypothetical protein
MSARVTQGTQVRFVISYLLVVYHFLYDLPPLFCYISLVLLKFHPFALHFVSSKLFTLHLRSLQPGFTRLSWLHLHPNVYHTRGDDHTRGHSFCLHHYYVSVTSLLGSSFSESYPSQCSTSSCSLERRETITRIFVLTSASSLR